MHVISGPVTLGLSCHPQAPSRAIQGIDAVVGSEADGMFTLSYVIKGDLSRLRIPERSTSRRAHALWAHTCLEAFVMAGNGPGYRELNFSPSGRGRFLPFAATGKAGKWCLPRPRTSWFAGPQIDWSWMRQSVMIFCRRGALCGWACPRSSRMLPGGCLTGRCDIRQASPISITLTPLRSNWYCPECMM